MLFVPASISTVQAQDSEIPAWIKNNAGWWATDLIDDSSFLQGIQYLIEEGIMVIPPTETSGSSGSQEVPSWIKNNAGWWADGQIDDNAFISGIQYLIKSGIIVVEQEQTPTPEPTPPETSGLPYFGAIIELDKVVYSLEDDVNIVIVAPNFNTNSNAIEYIGTDTDSRVTITTSKGTLDFYKLQETGSDTGVFGGSVSLEGQDYTGTSGTGPWSGKIKVGNKDSITIQFTNTYSGEANTVTTAGLVETSDNEIQKLADEYWDCFMGVDENTSSCVAWDEDKHAIEIEGSGDISEYWVGDSERGGINSCDTDCNLSLFYNHDVDAKLKKFQDEDLHKRLFDIFVSIAPKQILDEVVFLYIWTDGYGGAEAASIDRDQDYPLKFWLSIDPLDMAPSAGPIDMATMKVVMIHESAHILSLSSSQADNDAIPDDLYEEPYAELRELFQEKTSACANYYSDVPGCMNSNSYLNKFFQKFWVDVYPSFKWYFEFDDYDKFEDHNALFYKKYKTQFVTDYAATNPDEDFADSYMLFVLKEKPTKSTIADQKILFFYDFPELVEMRDIIRSNL